jgi:hypothetical protein
MTQLQQIGPYIYVTHSFLVCRKELQRSSRVAKVFGRKLAKKRDVCILDHFWIWKAIPMDVIGQIACQKHDDMQISDNILPRNGQDCVTAVKADNDVTTATVEAF